MAAEVVSRVRRQAVVAELGQKALVGTDLSQLLHEAAALVADTLRVEYSTVLELLPAGDALLLRAGAGWRKGAVGRALVKAGADSQAGYTLLSREPVIIRDLGKEKRFSAPNLKNHGVVSGISVVIHSQNGPFGVLGAHSVRRRRFTKDDVNFLQAVANVLAAAIERQRAEDALRESEAKYRRIFENVQDIFYRTDEKGIITEISPSVEKYAYTREQLIGTQVLDVYADPTERSELLKAVLERGEVIDYEVRLKTGDGRVAHTSVSTRVLRGPNGEFAGVEGSLRDISERKLAEEALRESEERLRTVISNAPLVLFAIDHEGVFTFAEGRGLAALGVQADEVVGRSIYDVFGDRPEIIENLRRALAGEMSSATVEVASVAFETHHTPIRDQAGEIVGVIGVATDVTERKRAEEALRASEERLRTVVTNAPVILSAIDRDGVYTLSEGKGLEALGQRPGEVVGRSVFEVCRDSPEVLKNVRRALAGEAFTAIVELAGFVFEARYSPIRDHAGNVTGAIGISTDMTERKRAEEGLRESEEKYRTLVQHFVDGIAIAVGVDVKFVNRALVEMLGYDDEAEMLDRPFTDFIAPEYRELLVERAEARQNGEHVPERYEHRALRKDGTEFPIEVGVAMVTYQGAPAFQVIVRDITERNRADEALRESEAKYRRIFENVQDIFYQTDEKGIIAEISPAAERYGYTREELIGTQVLDIYADPEERSELLKIVLERGEVVDYEVRLKAGDGRVIDASVSTHVLRGPNGEFAGVEGSLRDISERKRAEEALRESEERYQDLFENANDIIYAHDLTGRFTSINRAAEEATGYTREEALQENIAKILAPEYLEMAREMIMRKVHGEPSTTYELEMITKDGRRVPVEVGTRLITKDGKPIGVQGIARDISERKRFEAQLVHLANHDPLTGLFNRRRFNEELDRHLAQAQRYGTQGAVLFLDLDQFKDVNDSLGHRAGDELLSVLAGLLRDRLRETDVVARAGGDEFAILLPVADADQAQAVAAQLLEAMRRHTFVVGGHPVTITASIGVALFPVHGATAEELLSWADLAMYQAKENGPNAYSVHTPDRDWQAQIESRLGWQNRIREALEKNLFLLHAQPILNLHKDEISQYELLLRLARGNTIVAADSFVHIAERFGMIQAIDRWVVGQAIHLIADHRRAGQELRLEVNLSGKAFADSELLPLIRRELAETSIDPACLVLEVTETAAIANISEAQKFVRTLKGLGCRFALDDFGVGFSSFYHLKYLPVDYLKIDGSFIRELPSSPVDQHLVQAMVEVARGLGKQTIAEFVGSDETVDLLRKYGVDYAQGHHIGRPRDAAEILTAQKLDKVFRRRATG